MTLPEISPYTCSVWVQRTIFDEAVLKRTPGFGNVVVTLWLTCGHSLFVIPVQCWCSSGAIFCATYTPLFGCYDADIDAGYDPPKFEDELLSVRRGKIPVDAGLFRVRYEEVKWKNEK
ncbi:MAG: hypothetical protein ACNYVW_07330 [Methanosarcinales archaeon]